jgi:plasmid stability protein
MTKVIVTLREDERKALVVLALSELRSPADQARHILRQELSRRGLLPPDSAPADLAHDKPQPAEVAP